VGRGGRAPAPPPPAGVGPPGERGALRRMAPSRRPSRPAIWYEKDRRTFLEMVLATRLCDGSAHAWSLRTGDVLFMRGTSAGRSEAEEEERRGRGSGGEGARRPTCRPTKDLGPLVAATAPQRARPRGRRRVGTPSALRSVWGRTRKTQTPPEKPPGLPGGLFGLRARWVCCDERERRRFRAMRQ